MSGSDNDRERCRRYYRANKKALLERNKEARRAARAARGLVCSVCGRPIPQGRRSNVTCSPECAKIRQREQIREFMRVYRSRKSQEVRKVDDWQQAVIDVMNLPATERWSYSRHWGQRERNFARMIERRRMDYDRQIDNEIHWGNR